MISILCPTRGRPAMFKKMLDSALATAYTKPEIVIGIGSDEFIDAPEDNLGYDLSNVNTAIFCGPLPIVHVCNKLANKAKGDLLVVVGDDAVFATPGWDYALMDHYNALYNKIHVYSFRDSRSEHGTPHPIATREYVNAMGYIHTPIFTFFYPDTWMVEIAKANGCFTKLDDYMIIHDKPSDRGEADTTFKRVRDSGWDKRDNEVNRSCQHFLELEKARLSAIIKHKVAA